MPLFVIGFCYSIPLACGSTDALSHIMICGGWSQTQVQRFALERKPVVSNRSR